jgi:hypothetical protein
MFLNIDIRAAVQDIKSEGESGREADREEAA